MCQDVPGESGGGIYGDARRARLRRGHLGHVEPGNVRGLVGLASQVPHVRGTRSLLRLQRRPAQHLAAGGRWDQDV